MNIKVFCAVVFICWKGYMDLVHFYFSLDIGFFPFVVAKQLMECRCSKIYETGTLMWADQIGHFFLLICNLPIGFVIF